MTVEWKDKNSAKIIIEEIEKLRTIDESGKVRFQGLIFYTLKTLIYNFLNFSQEISEVDARFIVNKGIFNTGSTGEITLDNLIKEMNELEKNFLSIPKQRYVLVTSISINQTVNMRRINIDNNRIVIERTLHKRFHTSERNDLINLASKSIIGNLPTDYSYVRIFGTSRSVYGAANQAIDILNFFRGIWNYSVNRSFSFRRTFGGKPSPINRIVLGPIHTLHNYDGSLAVKNQWWYDPGYYGPIKPYFPNEKDFSTLMKAQQYMRKRISNLNYSKDIVSGIVRYCKALDERDMTSSFLKLWGVLEFLTSTTRTSYDVTIKRTASIYQKRDFHLQVLKVIRDYRNSYVHSDEETEEVETYLIQLKNYVESLIHFHLTNGHNFFSLSDSADFFDLPVYEKDLLKKLKLLKYAVKFRHY